MKVAVIVAGDYYSLNLGFCSDNEEGGSWPSNVVNEEAAEVQLGLINLEVILKAVRFDEIP